MSDPEVTSILCTLILLVDGQAVTHTRQMGTSVTAAAASLPDWLDELGATDNQVYVFMLQRVAG